MLISVPSQSKGCNFGLEPVINFQASRSMAQPHDSHGSGDIPDEKTGSLCHRATEPRNGRCRDRPSDLCVRRTGGSAYEAANVDRLSQGSCVSRIDQLTALVLARTVLRRAPKSSSSGSLSSKRSPRDFLHRTPTGSTGSCLTYAAPSITFPPAMRYGNRLKRWDSIPTL